MTNEVEYVASPPSPWATWTTADIMTVSEYRAWVAATTFVANEARAAREAPAVVAAAEAMLAEAWAEAVAS